MWGHGNANCRLRIYEGTLEGSRMAVACHNKDELKRIAGLNRYTVVDWKETTDASLKRKARSMAGQLVRVA